MEGGVSAACRPPGPASLSLVQIGSLSPGTLTTGSDPLAGAEVGWAHSAGTREPHLGPLSHPTPPSSPAQVPILDCVSASRKGDRIYHQLKKLGSSLDWDRACFTMDPVSGSGGVSGQGRGGGSPRRRPPRRKPLRAQP